MKTSLKTPHVILYEIWKALERKTFEDSSGLESSSKMFSDFIADFSQLGETLRYAECLHQLQSAQVHAHILKFVEMARKAAMNQTTDRIQMHRLARDIFVELDLPNFLFDAQVFFPERTRHLYRIITALDYRVDKCSSGLTHLHPSVIAYYESMLPHCHMLLDSSQHKNIFEEVERDLTNGFVKAISEAAYHGKAGEFHKTNAMSILRQLKLQDLIPMMEPYFPERNKNGTLILVEKDSECLRKIV